MERFTNFTVIVRGLQAPVRLAKCSQAPGAQVGGGQHWGRMGQRSNHAVQPTPCAVGINNDADAASAHAAADGER